MCVESQSDEVLSACVANVLWVEINRPKQRNALNLRTLGALRTLFEKYAGDASLVAAVLSAAGDRSFAAGGDLKELSALRTPDDASRIEESGHAALEAIRTFPVPVIAALNGAALGGGAELALACDMRIATETASIGFLQAKLAITTAWGGATDLMSLLDPTRALPLLLSGRVLSAAEAHACGLVDRVVTGDTSLRDAVSIHISDWAHRPAHVIRAFTSIARESRRGRRLSLRSIERSQFIATWVDDAHWAAAADVLKSKPA